MRSEFNGLKNWFEAALGKYSKGRIPAIRQIASSERRGKEVWRGGDSLPLTDDLKLADALLKAQIEIANLKNQIDAQSPKGNAFATVTGRILDVRGYFIHLAIQAESREYFRLVVKLPDEEDRAGLEKGANITLTCRIIAQGRYLCESILELIPCTEPLPEIMETPKKDAIPDWFGADERKARKLMKASEGSSSVSDLRVHLVWATKYRGRILTAPMVERMKVLSEELIRERNLGELLAMNAEANHVHVVLWLPNRLSASEVVALLKAYLSRELRKEFPVLLNHNSESLWQRGFYAGAIGNGGDLSAVLEYVTNQNSPKEESC